MLSITRSMACPRRSTTTMRIMLTISLQELVHFVLLLHLLLSFAPALAQKIETIHGPNIHLTFSYGYDYAPDCVRRQPLVLVNDVWPPPILRIQAGDRITLTATNDLVTVAFSIHLHGFDQVGTPWADGTSMVSTCPIAPDTSSSIQVFDAPSEPGTYIYHGHVAHAKVSGFTGMLLVDENPERGLLYPSTYDKFDDELVLLMGDSYHAPQLPAVTGLLQQQFRWPGEPQSVLMNGVSFYDCNNAANGDESQYFCEDPASALCALGITSNHVCGASQPVYYNNLVHCSSDQCPDRATLQVSSGKTYLLRIANGGIMSMLNLAIAGHNMTVVELDGQPVVPRQVENLDLAVGQRAAVLLTANQIPGVYWINARVRGRAAIRQGQALLDYDGLSDASKLQGVSSNDGDLQTLQESQPASEDWESMRYSQRSYEALSLADYPDDSQVAKTFHFMGTQERFDFPNVNHAPQNGDDSGMGIGNSLDEKPQCFCNADDGFLRWAVNRKTFLNAQTPILHSLYFETNTETEQELADKGIYKLEEGKVYDVVLQNYPACSGGCETHPWHLHGHTFWHVGTFEGLYDPKVGYPADETGPHYKRDTILVIGTDAQNKTPASGEQCSDTLEPCGYTIIRFVADNPGAWFFHCHIDWHLIMGMAVVFYYDDLPNSAPEPDLSLYNVCGDVYPQVVVDWAMDKQTRTTRSAMMSMKMKKGGLRSMKGMRSKRSSMKGGAKGMRPRNKSSASSKGAR